MPPRPCGNSARQGGDSVGMTLAIHILGGGLGLLSGYVALYAAKGATLHRRSGIVFVYSMLTMTLFGALMAAVENNRWTSVNVSAATLTSYLVITALTTVRPFSAGGRWLDLGGMLLASALALTDLTFGL